MASTSNIASNILHCASIDTHDSCAKTRMLDVNSTHDLHYHVVLCHNWYINLLRWHRSLLYTALPFQFHLVVWRFLPKAQIYPSSVHIFSKRTKTTKIRETKRMKSPNRSLGAEVCCCAKSTVMRC